MAPNDFIFYQLTLHGKNNILFIGPIILAKFCHTNPIKTKYEKNCGGNKVNKNSDGTVVMEISDQNYDKVNHLLKTMGYVCIQKWRRDYLYQFKAKS